MKKHTFYKIIFTFLISFLIFNCPNPDDNSYPPVIDIIDDDSENDLDQDNENENETNNEENDIKGEESNNDGNNDTIENNITEDNKETDENSETGESINTNDNNNDNENNEVPNEDQHPEITDFSFEIINTKIRSSYATQGTVIGIINNIEGGTPPYSYQLISGNGINDTNNDRFFVDGTRIKIRENRLISSTYYFNLAVFDNNNKSFSKSISIIIHPDPVSKEQELRNVNNVEFAMRYIPSGSFYSVYFGDDINHPEMMSISSGYWMSETEVTQELFQSVMGYNPSMYNNSPEYGEVQIKRPVENVSFIEAIIFCNRLSQLSGREPVYKISDIDEWLTYPNAKINDLNINLIEEDLNADGYRIPSDFEWQWAAIGADIGGYNLNGLFKRYSGGSIDSWEGIDNYVWYLDNSDWKTREVGKKLPNEMGIYDMSGNVMEYVSNRYAIGSSSFSSRLQHGWIIYQTTSYYPQTPHNPIGIRIVSNR